MKEVAFYCLIGVAAFCLLLAAGVGSAMLRGYVRSLRRPRCGRCRSPHVGVRYTPGPVNYCVVCGLMWEVKRED